MVDNILFRKVGISWVAHTNGMTSKLSILHILCYYFSEKRKTKTFINRYALYNGLRPRCF